MNAKDHSKLRFPAVFAAAAVLLLTPGSLMAQDRPEPAAPVTRGTNGNNGDGNGSRQSTQPTRIGERGDMIVGLSFDNWPIADTFPFIAESTGKVVMPVEMASLRTKNITLMSNQSIERAKALDMLIQAFRLNGVGVIEDEEVIIVGLLDQLTPTKRYPVISADEDIMQRDDKGSLVYKIYRLEEVRAADVAEQLGDNLPSHAALSVDANSNQIMLQGDVALCQTMQKIIWELDNRYLEPRTQTFRLAYADATEISQNILDLFENTGQPGGGNQNQGRTGRAAVIRGGQPQAPRPGETGVGPQVEIRVTVNVLQNSVTVYAEPDILDYIAGLVADEWDLPRSAGTTRIYNLRYTDPIKVADKLNALLGQSTGQGARSVVGGRGVGQGGDIAQILGGIYRIEPYPDSYQLLVFCKTEESILFLDQFIEQIDQPTTVGLPFVVELKHASAMQLSEQLNALLAQAGASATITAPEEGLQMGGSVVEGEGFQGGSSTTPNSTAGEISFPWQRSGQGNQQEESPVSPLIGKLRIVPIVRQNALAVLCPRPQEEAVEQLINFFDRPGRQVMLSVIIAEVQLSDNLTLGARLSSSDAILTGTSPDLRFGGSASIEGTKENLLPGLFDTSVLNANVNINAVIQALSEETNLRILQKPMVFTADNQEAFFFDGQSIPFITDTVINSQGNPTDSFEYKDVGVILNVRPRITINRDVDMELRLELSAVVPGQTLFGGAIVDKRQTSAHVVVQNGQTIVLSGIMKESESKTTRGIPLLSDIPLIGELFKHRENSTERSELVAFITPQVVDNPEENDNNFQKDYRKLLEELTRPIGEQEKQHRKDPKKFHDRLIPQNIDEDGLQRTRGTVPVDVDETPSGASSRDSIQNVRRIAPSGTITQKLREPSARETDESSGIGKRAVRPD